MFGSWKPGSGEGGRKGKREERERLEVGGEGREIENIFFKVQSLG